MNRFHCEERGKKRPLGRAEHSRFFFTGAFSAWESLTEIYSSFLYSRHILFDLYLIYAVLARVCIHAINNIFYFMKYVQVS